MITKKGDRFSNLVEQTGKNLQNTANFINNDTFIAKTVGELAEKQELRPAPYQQEWLASGAAQETVDLNLFWSKDSHSPVGGAA